MAERLELLTKANQIARLIFIKLNELRCKPVKDMGLGSWLSLFKLQADIKEGESLKEEALDSLDPKIYEVILFGSVAEGKKDPTDIDLMIFDNGHFSNFLPCMTNKHHMNDWYENLGENFQWFMSGWFGVHDDQLQQMLDGVEVDLHVLPMNFFKSKKLREEITEKHKDSNFFKNAFEKAMRFDRSTDQFELLTLEYLEEKFRCQLLDLR
ncbi:nucleotidyltransferase domain-containing protein [bacterium]|nr:MAG: nucleotidyltransferase domain-containing protein [bacterium]